VKLFVAGATGATGQVLLPIAEAAGHTVVPHVRPATAARHELSKHPRAVVCELSDVPALTEALRACDAVISLVGTMRKRFSTGDTYETSDIGTTRSLVEAAKAAGVPCFVLLSSVGAGGAGPYLQAKAEAERIVRESGLRWIIARPSALATPADARGGTHGRREVPAFVLGLGGLLARLPAVGPLIDDWRAIPLDVVSRGMLAALEQPGEEQLLLGRDLWRLA
jgi:nucleoside-diphosphate-sugar epimerase